MIAERGDHLRQGGVGVLLSGHRLWQAQHLRADFGLYVVRQSAKLKDDLGDSVNGGVDMREAEASGRGGERATQAPAFVSILEIFATFPPDLTNPDTNLHRELNIELPECKLHFKPSPLRRRCRRRMIHLCQVNYINAIHELIRALTAVTHISRPAVKIIMTHNLGQS